MIRPLLFLRVATLVILSVTATTAHALNIFDILRTCPQDDPIYATIRADFEIRRNGVVVGNIPCTDPVSSVPTAQYTDELIVLQGLRAIYHMYMPSGHLPWTTLPLYYWMKSKIGGIDIRTDASSSYCCETFNGRPYIVIQAEDDSNRDFDREWRGIAGNIDLYAHETRHVDGFAHVQCCSVSGCDQTFDLNNLSPYGIQWWLNKAWLTGELYVGYSCLTPSEVNDIANWHLSACNIVEYNRFCDNHPPVQSMPAQPGGPCRTSGVSDIEARGFVLAPAIPNPTVGATNLDFEVGHFSRVRLAVRDVQGRDVATLAQGYFTPGHHHLAWDGRIGQNPAPAGLYFVCYDTPEGSLVRRVAVTR